MSDCMTGEVEETGKQPCSCGVFMQLAGVMFPLRGYHLETCLSRIERALRSKQLCWLNAG